MYAVIIFITIFFVSLRGDELNGTYCVNNNSNNNNNNNIRSCCVRNLYSVVVFVWDTFFDLTTRARVKDIILHRIRLTYNSHTHTHTLAQIGCLIFPCDHDEDDEKRSLPASASSLCFSLYVPGCNCFLQLPFFLFEVSARAKVAEKKQFLLLFVCWEEKTLTCCTP